MKLFIALLSIMSAAKTNAAGAIPPDSDADLAAFLEDLEAPVAGEDGRSLYGVADDCEAKNGNPAQAYYYPNPPSDYNNGICSYGVQCTYMTYTSEEACCLENFQGQKGSECLIKAGLAPTESPTTTKQQGSGSSGGTGGGTGYYSVMANNWLEGTCTNERPFPAGQEWWEDHLYDSMLECCKAIFPNQSTGKCVAQLPDGERPTGSPTTVAEAGTAGIYYPDYDTAWTVAGCLNTLPLPYNRHNGQPDRPEFATMAECCARSYGGQVSGKCLSMMNSDSDSAPTSADFYYRDYSVAWDVGTCTNALPLPIQVTEGSNTHSSKEACCKSRFGGQMSNACVCDLDVPAKVCYEIKTTSVTTTLRASTLGVTIPDPLPTGWELTKLVSDLIKAITAQINSVSGEDEEVKKVTILAIDGTPIKNYRRLGELLLSNKNSRSLGGDSQIKTKIEMQYSCLPGRCSEAEKKLAEVAEVGFFYKAEWCTKDDNKGFLKFPSSAGAAKLEKEFPAIKGGIFMDQRLLDAEFCIEKDASLVSTGANSRAGLSPHLYTKTLPSTFTQDEMNTVCFAMCSKDKDCDFLQMMFYKGSKKGECYLYSYAANKPSFKISPFVDEHLIAVVAKKKVVPVLEDAASMQCDVPGDGAKLQNAILCASGQPGCLEGGADLISDDLLQYILPAFMCIAIGGGNTSLCMGCLSTQLAQNNCVDAARGICRDDAENFIFGLCKTQCELPTASENDTRDCNSAIQTALLCAKGAPRTTYLDPLSSELQIGGGCVNRGYDANTPDFLCPLLPVPTLVGKGFCKGEVNPEDHYDYVSVNFSTIIWDVETCVLFCSDTLPVGFVGIVIDWAKEDCKCMVEDGKLPSDYKNKHGDSVLEGTTKGKIVGVSGSEQFLCYSISP